MSHGSSTTLTSTGRQALVYARRASTARRLPSSDPTSVDFDWSELYWTLFFIALCVAGNVYMIRYHFDSVVRGLTLIFCGPPPRRPRVPQREVYYQEVHYDSTPARRRDDDPFWYIYELALPSEQEEQVCAEPNAPVPMSPSGEPSVGDGPTSLLVADVVKEPEEEDPEHQERRRVRSAARCQRVRKQKAQDHERKQEQKAFAESSSALQVNAEDPGPQAENTKERWGTRGGNKVRKRQKTFERKLAARAAARAEAGPSSIPPVFNDENFPLLTGSACKPKLPQVNMSYALVAAVVPPSLSALVRHAEPYMIRANPAADFERPQPEDKGKAVYYPIEELAESRSWDELMKADEVAAGSSRKGKRRKKGNG